MMAMGEELRNTVKSRCAIGGKGRGSCMGQEFRSRGEESRVDNLVESRGQGSVDGES
jgi:hypothetical protein